MIKDMYAVTQIENDPGPDAGEAEIVVFALERSRAQFAWKAGGLDDAAVHRPHPPSMMTIAGIVKHMALVEDWYTCGKLTGEPMMAPWNTVNFPAHPNWEWTSAAEDSAETLYGLWLAAVGRSRTAVATLLSNGGLDQPSTLPWDDGRRPNLRRLFCDLHDEYARHVGHLDLFREATDGLVGEDPPQHR